MVAAPRSGSGKTTLTLALLSAFRRRGLVVRALKTGPDYIDPAFHEAATGQACGNLDSWAMSPDALRTRLLQARMAQAGRHADLLIVESSMGLFDGLTGPEGARGAAADIAARFGIPVLLVLDVRGQGQSVGAVAEGMARWSDRVAVRAVVLNHVGSARHEALCRDALRLPCLGAFRRDAAIALPERHLGLVQARERGDLPGFFSLLADKAEKELDLDAILAEAAELPPEPPPEPRRPENRRQGERAQENGFVPPPGQRIALADDAAFSFLYAHLAQDWRAAGAEILPFSPLADEGPDERADCCWLPGGYPEIHAGRLAGAERFRDGMRAFAQTRPVHGECGGYMVLGASLEDASGKTHAMLGLLSHGTSFARRKMALGYREAHLLNDTLLGPAGRVLRGHEFHYARVVDPGQDAPFATLFDGEGRPLGPAGGQRARVSGTFFHMLAHRS